jgi:hypothetical protein
MTFVSSPDFVLVGTNAVATVASIPAGSAPATLSITLQVDPSFMGASLSNDAEITADDGDDVDSTPGDNATPNATAGDGDTANTTGGDDQDPASIMINQVFDLSLDKQVSDPMATYSVYDDVEFMIIVTNEGSLDAFNIDVIDYVQDGFAYSDNDTNGWMTDANGDLTNVIPGPLAPGESATLRVVMTVTPQAYILGLDEIENIAEITSAEDADGAAVDIDSNPDSTLGNDMDDEDDVDPEMVQLDELDPTGYIYCEKTGAIITGGTITVTGPGNVIYGTDADGNLLDGTRGAYQFFVDAAGTYDIVYTHPLGYPVSVSCPAIAGTYDPTGDDGAAIDRDGQVNNEIVLGSDATNGVLDDNACGSNTYFLSVDLQPNDPPLIAFNNIPVQCGVISGTVCEDTDSNGIGDATDPGRSGITVALYNCGDLTTPVATTTTDADGAYSFEGLIQGCYSLSFDIPADYGVLDNNFVNESGQTAEINLAWGQCIEDGDFCISQVGSIGDYVWKDLNGNGIQDAGEPGVSGVTVILEDCNGTVITQTVTDASGNYQFDSVLPGEYRVRFDISALPSGCVFGATNAGDGDNDSDADNNGLTPCITLGAGETNTSVDAGLLPLASLGDYVWSDANANGIQDFDEQGIANVRVELYNSNGFFIDATFTDNSGFYIFDDLYPGSYYVRFESPAGSDLTLTNSNVGGDDSLDSNVDNSNGPGTTPIVVLGPGENDLTIDAGFYECIKIGDYVWFDYNENDLQDISENGINGIKVELYRSENGSWVLWDTEYTGHEPGTPSGDGYFKFCTAPGTYYLRFVNPPLKLVPVVANFGINENIDSDVTGMFGSGTTDSFTVESGDERCDIGAGFYTMGAIGDYVWLDDNGNGMRESGESGLSNVVVRAITIEGEEVASATTDANGQYMIDYLGKNSYYLEFELPSGYSVTQANVGSDESMDSDVDNSNGPNTTKYYTIWPGEYVEHVDAGVTFKVLSIEWNDIWVENKESHHELSWSVAYERNVSHYEIQRSIDGLTDFQEVGKMITEGDSESEVTYTYDDYDLVGEGIYYYRVVEVELSGAHNASEIVSVSREDGVRGNTALDIYPNPVVSEVTFELNVVRSINELSIDIYDSQGRLVMAKAVIDYDVEEGIKAYKLNVDEMAKGVYTVRVNMDNSIINRKIIVID